MRTHRIQHIGPEMKAIIAGAEMPDVVFAASRRKRGDSFAEGRDARLTDVSDRVMKKILA